jgi:kynurenine formamidase
VDLLLNLLKLKPSKDLFKSPFKPLKPSSFAHPTQPQSQINHQHRLKKLHNTQLDSGTQFQHSGSTIAAPAHFIMSKPLKDLPSLKHMLILANAGAFNPATEHDTATTTT